MEHRYKIQYPAHDTEIKFSADDKSADHLMTALLAHFSDDHVIISRETPIFDGTSGSDESYNALEKLL
jgi:hypothetical protein